MALVALIKSVTHMQTVPIEGGGTRTVDLSLTGELIVVAEYVDSDQPATVIHTQSFQVPASEDETQIAARVTGFGKRVRDARVRTAQLQAHVGVLLPIPD